jgi:hypothetical protein
MYRGVPQNLLMARRCRSFTVTVNFGGSSSLQVSDGQARTATLREGAVLADIGDVSSSRISGSATSDQMFRESSDPLLDLMPPETLAQESAVAHVRDGEHMVLRDKQTLGFKSGDEVSMKVSASRLIVETLHHADDAAVSGVDHSDVSSLVESITSAPNEHERTPQRQSRASHQFNRDALMDAAETQEDDNFDELASRLESAKELRLATENVTVKCQSTGNSLGNIGVRLVHLRQQRHKMNEACNLPRGIPCYAALGNIVCQGPPHECRVQTQRKRSCCAPQIPVEREIRACQAAKIASQVANDPALIGSMSEDDGARGSNSASTLEDSSGTSETVRAELERKQELLRKQHLARKIELQTYWKNQEDELYNWKLPQHVNSQSTLEDNSQSSSSVTHDGPGQKKELLRQQDLARKAEQRSYWRNQEDELYNWKPPADEGLPQPEDPSREYMDATLIDTENADTNDVDSNASARANSSAAAQTLAVQFACMDTDMVWKSVWNAQAPVVPGSCTGYSCDYRVTIPCNAVAGQGVLSGRLSNGQSVELGQRIFVLFDPYSSGDEFFANMSQVDRQSTLLQETGGIWGASGIPVFWTFGQFSPPSWQLAMLLLDDIPLSQRSMGARVVRWITYFIPTILQGRWCSPPKCFDDGKRPWFWHGSIPIFQEYLRTRRPVKYAQCWIFAGSAVSLYRSMGIAARTVSNYNSAHGASKNHAGVDSFYFYGNDFQLSARANPQNSIWTFHVWSEVNMKRLDLPYRIANGWQVADATPQEEACVPTPGGQSACRFMMGPASVNLARLGPSSPHVNDPYDTKFLIGETVGSLRSWRPKYVNWRTCPGSCVRNSIGDGNCDKACNLKGCDWDMGDCCPNTCSGSLPIRPFACGGSGYACRGIALGWTMLYLPDKSYIGKSLTTQRSGGAWNQPVDLTRNYKNI